MISVVSSLSESERTSFTRVEKWTEKARTFLGNGSTVVLVGNKADKQEERVVSFEEGQQAAEKLGVLFCETSAKLSTNMSSLI